MTRQMMDQNMKWTLKLSLRAVVTLCVWYVGSLVTNDVGSAGALCIAVRLTRLDKRPQKCALLICFKTLHWKTAHKETCGASLGDTLAAQHKALYTQFELITEPEQETQSSKTEAVR